MTTHFVLKIKELAKKYNTGVQDAGELEAWRQGIGDKPPELFSYIFKQCSFEILTEHFPKEHPGFNEAFKLWEQIRTTNFTDFN